MNEKKAYVVATAHLDTVWRWSLAKTIEEFIPDTLSKNFDLIEKYPNYRFNFEGAFRYELIEEFYPKAFAIIKEYVKQGKWCVAGASYENGDVNIPSPEALFRNILIGNGYFLKKFGVKSEEIFLPDCFGFGWALPSIIKNAGLKGFTTQKLSWGSAYGLPFDLGIWRGPDGSEAFVNLNARSYRYKFSDDVRADWSIIDRVADNNANGSLPWTNHLYGTGDWGGSPTEESVKAVNDSVNGNKDSDFKVISASSDQVFKDMSKLSKADKEKLPVWDTELVMTNHGAGGYTSRVHSKRLNYQCEELASLTEPLCYYAHSKGLINYPKDNLTKAWKNVIKHQFHDDITGTSTMDVYNNESWNDYSIALSSFRNEYFNAARNLAYSIDTSWVRQGASCIVASNSSQFKRRKSINVKGHLGRNSFHIKAYDRAGNELPCQLIDKHGKRFEAVINIELEPYSVKAIEIVPSDEDCTIDTGLKVTNHTLENSRYLIKLNRNGDIAYLYDKELGKQIISSPIKLALLHDTSSLAYPSWEMRKEDIDKEPYCYANTPEFEIVEDGPARISILVKREAEYSLIYQTISLEPDSAVIEVNNKLDWKTRRTMLKAVFPLAAANSKATYDLGLGVIERGNNSDKLYEVPAQHWADITDASGEFGVSILSDCKYGWDKPSDNTLRLTCIHTPTGAFTKDARQDLQDLGKSEFTFGIYAHKNGWENGTQKECALFTSHVDAIEISDRTKGSKELESLFNISNDEVIVRAVKMAEDDEALIIRVNEANGKSHRNVTITTFEAIESATEVNSSEEYIKDINVSDKTIRFSLKPFEVKTFKINIKPKKKHHVEKYIPLDLEYNAKGFTTDENMRHVILQGSGVSLPLELLPKSFKVSGIEFKNDRKPDDRFDVLVCSGQQIEIPEGCSRLYFLAASTVGRIEEDFNTDKKTFSMVLNQLNTPIDTMDMEGLDQKGSADGKIDVGFEFTHTNHPEGPTAEKAIFGLYSVDAKNKKYFILPENPKIVIIAATAVKNMADVRMATSKRNKIKMPWIDVDIPPVDKLIDKADFITIRAGKIQDQRNGGKGKGFKRDNIITNIIRSYTKSEW